ncbi:potassium transporter TrkG [Streptomyces sp. N35]|uniref:TrkH family potassium uptake protein n=1 Tax=Streptomyces sp. N35 TaxID=2795730 RepID=UPI0027DC0C3D|nr:potassium transporter TrkG [Streptomyces sp. N35]
MPALEGPTPRHALPGGHRLWRLAARPASVGSAGFAAVILVGAILLWLPQSSSGADGPTFLSALFTATSAVCVTGLNVVDAAQWSDAGQVVIIVLIQLGGFGIMAFASLLGLLVSGRLKLRMELNAQAETKSGGQGDVRRVLLNIAKTTVVIEAAAGLMLACRFHFAYGESVGHAMFSGGFHAVSAFNNAGFGLRSDNVVSYSGDPWVLLPITGAVVLGGIGFPVLFELLRGTRRRARGAVPHRLRAQTRLTVVVTGALLFSGTLLTCLLEWSNAHTLGSMNWSDKLLNGLFHTAISRTAGFASFDTGALHTVTILATCVLMFIGGGSSGTAGGIKVTTFAVLAATIRAEVRGDRDVEIMGRRLAETLLRQAITIALLGVGLVTIATLLLVELTGLPTEAVLFEAVSAFSTTGSSTGITGGLPASGQIVLILLMFIGRIGPATLASALALRDRRHHYRLPEERLVIG